MLNVQINIQGTPELINKFKRLNSGLTDFSPAMTEIGKLVEDYYSGQVFSSQGAVLGLKWPTLKATTIKNKLKHYPQYATTPLIRTGAMKNSFKSKPTRKDVTISNTAEYFKYHQSTAARSKLPRRAMMSINKDVKSIVKQVIEADIAKKLRTA